MAEKCVMNGVFNSVVEKEWLAFFEEEQRSASAHDNNMEKVYDRHYREFQGATL